MITHSLFRQIKDPKHPLHYLLPPVKVSHSQMVLWPTIHIKFHWPKLHVVEGTLYHIALPVSFSSAAQSAYLGLFCVRVFN